MERPVLLCGLGRVGWRVLDSLRAAGLPVVVIDLKVEGLSGNVDGVRVDSAGLVYLTCPGGICVVDPARGVLLERMAVPKRATNLAWGGPELSDLYVTAQSDLYRVKTRAQGTGSSSRR